MAGEVTTEAFVTLATTDQYCLGALVLGQSLRRVKTSRQLVVMISKDVSQDMRSQLQQTFHHVIEVDVLDSRDHINLDLMTRPDLGVTFTKLHCWRLTQFDKCVFLDADTLVLQTVDELFEREELSAAPDAGWPDCFNSGVFVFKPSLETYSQLLEFALSKGSFDGGDQGLLNLYFSDWATKDIEKHLPFIYNTVSQAFYSYLPAFKQFGNTIKITHFIGATKPWHHNYNTTTHRIVQTGEAGHNWKFLQLWWDIFVKDIWSRMPKSMSEHKSGEQTYGTHGELAPKHLRPTATVLIDQEGVIGQLAAMSVGGGEASGVELTDEERRRRWEEGKMDYRGLDAFANIQNRIDAALEAAAPTTPPYTPLSVSTTSSGASTPPQKKSPRGILKKDKTKA